MSEEGGGSGLGEGRTHREPRRRREAERRRRNAVLASAYLMTVAAPLTGLPQEFLWPCGGLTAVLAGAWHGWGGGLLVAALLAGATLGFGAAGWPAVAGKSWWWLAGSWTALAAAAAWTRGGLERRADERRREYQELAEEHLRTHERFEALTGRLREKNEALERKYGEASALLSAAGAIGNSTNPGDIYETIVDTAVKLVACDVCVLAVMQDTNQPWPIVGTRGSFSAWRKGDRVRLSEGVLGWVAQHGQPVVVEDLAKDARFAAAGPEQWFRSLVAVPLLIEGHVAAVLGVGRADEPPLNQDAYWTLTSLAGHAAVALHRAYLHEELSRLARTDGLTGLFNRRSFDEELHREIIRAKRYQSPLSVILLDIDHFKQFNDRHGHPLGDRLLQLVAEVIRSSIRQADYPARYGGEEFVVILPETGPTAALRAAERIRQGVAALGGEEAKTQPLGHFSVSVGLASYPVPCAAPEELVKQADLALYEAKRAGRDRCQACKDFLAG